MKFAYADPPYLGMGQRLYGTFHDEAHVWDRPSTHLALVERLVADYPDGWAMSLSSPSLATILPMCPSDVRVAAWVKPFAAFKPNVPVAYTWEPVIFTGGRRRGRDEDTVRDHLSENITLQKGLPGAKPERFCAWILDLLGWEPDDTVDDLYPGTGVMGRVIAARSNITPADGLALWEEAPA
jgi:hypothetical protein